MTTGSTDNVDALFLRDAAVLAADGAPPPETVPDREVVALALADRVGSGYLFRGRYPHQEAEREQFRRDADAAISALSGAGWQAAVEFADDLAQLDGLKAWVETVLDRVPEAYGDRDKPEEIIDRWLDDLVNLYDAAGYWRFQYKLAERGMSEAGTFDAAESSLAQAFDRVRTDEEGETDG